MIKKLKSYLFFIMAVWAGSAFLRKLAAMQKENKQYYWTIDRDGLPTLVKRSKYDK